MLNWVLTLFMWKKHTQLKWTCKMLLWSCLQTTKEEDEMRLRELEKNYSKEKKRAEALQKELEALKVCESVCVWQPFCCCCCCCPSFRGIALTPFVSQAQPCLRFILHHCLAVHGERSQTDGRLLGDHSLLPNLCRGHVGMPEDGKPANWVGFGIDTGRTLWIIKMKIDWNLVTRSRDKNEARLWIVTQRSSFLSFRLLLLALCMSLKKFRHGCYTPHAPLPVPIQCKDSTSDAPLS